MTSHGPATLWTNANVDTNIVHHQTDDISVANSNVVDEVVVRTSVSDTHSNSVPNENVVRQVRIVNGRQTIVNASEFQQHANV
jgi:hypothetical protein